MNCSKYISEACKHEKKILERILYSGFILTKEQRNLRTRKAVEREFHFLLAFTFPRDDRKLQPSYFNIEDWTNVISMIGIPLAGLQPKRITILPELE